ncbi:MAG TPA: hemerythrin [Firmicutes bacterium]|nr:hemerythrin [Bacillota bacterium]
MLPTQILKDEHRIIESVLDCLEKMADGIDAGKSLDETSARDAIDFIRNFADKCHHAKEEDKLFPAMEAVGIPSQGGPIGVMLYEHDLGRGYVKNMDRLIPDAVNGDKNALKEFTDNARAFIGLLREHIQKEDFILYPLADQSFSPEDQEKLMASFEDVENHEIGHGVHEKYLGIADRLCRIYGVERRKESEIPQTGCSFCH